MTSTRAEFKGELRSGDFGPDTGHFHVFAEVYGSMARGGWRNANGCYPTREEARKAIGPTGGHQAIVGVPADTCRTCNPR